MTEEKNNLEDELKEVKEERKASKKPYIKPELISEKLMTFGAVCNGSSTGGRKAATGAPNFCRANRLSS